MPCGEKEDELVCQLLGGHRIKLGRDLWITALVDPDFWFGLTSLAVQIEDDTEIMVEPENGICTFVQPSTNCDSKLLLIFPTCRPYWYKWERVFIKFAITSRN